MIEKFSNNNLYVYNLLVSLYSFFSYKKVSNRQTNIGNIKTYISTKENNMANGLSKAFTKDILLSLLGNTLIEMKPLMRSLTKAMIRFVSV